MTDVMCGKRGAPSRADATAAQLRNWTVYKCPTGKTACSSNPNADGTPFCADLQNGELCPITELVIMDANQYATSNLKDDSRYEKRISSQASDATAS